jgi:hypothetical protein
MILIAFDVDGVIDCAGGPVDWAKVRLLTAEIGIVSPSVNRPKDDTGSYVGGSTRAANLKHFASMFPAAKLKLYVSDNMDMDEAIRAGFVYIDAHEFASGLM